MLKFIKKLFRFIFRHWFFLSAFSLGIVAVFVVRSGVEYTSSDEFCESCHVHPRASSSWKLGSHRDTKSGVVAHCVDCHLPPGGFSYLREKTKTGLRDVFGKLFKDTGKIDWEMKSRREFAVNHVYKSGCINCHQNLYPRDLKKKGQDAHLYYEQNSEKLRCINCHLEVGHYHKKKPILALEEKSTAGEIFTEPAKVTAFKNFIEKVPGSMVSFEMIAIPGGKFVMGSPASEEYREADEGPQHTVELSPFWMGKTEISWDEYNAFFKQTYRGGRTEDQVIQNANDVSSITGPTPAYEDPSQGWGIGKHPAITMTFYAATIYCKWLSQVTGKKYRLPTEAEWEYAARGNTSGAYFFPGEPSDFSKERLWNKIFGTDTTINSFIIYRDNSRGRPHLPRAVKVNPFGLLNMLGNVKEFCSDWYSPTNYSNDSKNEKIKNPPGPPQGEEHVIRGGSFRSGVGRVRAADRDHTQHEAWMVTDPQIPKSLWWYSDNNEVGFRVVCEYRDELIKSE